MCSQNAMLFLRFIHDPPGITESERGRGIFHKVNRQWGTCMTGIATHRRSGSNMIIGNATHQAAVLGLMAALPDTEVTIEMLDRSLPIGRKQIATATGKLIQRSYVERSETGVYRLTLTGRQALATGVSLTSGPHRGQRKHPFYADSLQQRAWAAMRLTSRFTIGSIAQLAARDTDKHPEQALQRFFHRLTRAGYLVELPTRVKAAEPTSNGFKQWRLIRDTGAHSPRWLDRRQAFKDWNTREVFPCA